MFDYSGIPRGVLLGGREEEGGKGLFASLCTTDQSSLQVQISSTRNGLIRELPRTRGARPAKDRHKMKFVVSQSDEPVGARFRFHTTPIPRTEDGRSWNMLRSIVFKGICGATAGEPSGVYLSTSPVVARADTILSDQTKEILKNLKEHSFNWKVLGLADIDRENMQTKFRHFVVPSQSGEPQQSNKRGRLEAPDDRVGDNSMEWISPHTVSASPPGTLMSPITDHMQTLSVWEESPEELADTAKTDTQDRDGTEDAWSNSGAANTPPTEFSVDPFHHTGGMSEVDAFFLDAFHYLGEDKDLPDQTDEQYY